MGLDAACIVPAVAVERRGLYRSLWASLLLTCNPALQFTAFEQARRRVLAPRPGGQLSAAEAFVLGALSKALATGLTYPLIRAKVLLQAARPGAPASLAGTAAGVVGAEGLGGLYRGLGVQLAKTVAVAALQLMVKEQAFGAAYLAVQRAQAARQRTR